MVKTLTEQLELLYNSYSKRFENMIAKFEDSGISGPILLSPAETLYVFQETRLLLIAPEIRDWSTGTIAENMKAWPTRKINNEANYGFASLRSELEKRLGIDPGQSAWTGLSKFAFRMSALDVIYQPEITAFDEILLGEIVRLKPDVVIFFTGPENDLRLANVFDGMKFRKTANFSLFQVASLHHVFFPKHTYRVARPADLFEKNMDQEVIDFIVGQQKSSR